MTTFLGRLAVACTISASIAFAANVVDSRDNHSYKVFPSGKMNWFSSDVNYAKTAGHKVKNTAYYDAEARKDVCPAGTHIPTASEWNDLKKDRFSGPRKTPNVKNFAGKTRGYFVKGDKKKKIKNKDVSYFAIDGIENEVVILDLKRGNMKVAKLPANAMIPVRCVSERDIYAEKNISKKDMMMTDPRDGNKYPVEIKAGKFWTKSNMKFSLTTAKQCFLEDTLFCTKHGRFYTHTEAKKTCPTGWHLPDDGEWRDFQREGVNWNNMGVGGCRDWDEYCDQANTGHYWSATSIKKNTGRSWEFRRQGKSINRTDESVQKGLYVRCVADME